MADLNDIVTWMDLELDLSNWPDFAGACNGLQVDAGSGKIRRVGFAVDASLSVAEEAAEADVDLVLVHHGLLWGGRQPLVRQYGAMIRLLMQNGVSLYSAHLPLDGHPRLGNNAVLAAQLGLYEVEPFGEYEGRTIGCGGWRKGGTQALLSAIVGIVGGPVVGTPFHSDAARVRVAVVSGGAADSWGAARDSGYDLLLTGEARHNELVAAAEVGFGLWTAGHYETETFGVAALAQQLCETFDMASVSLGRAPATLLT